MSSLTTTPAIDYKTLVQDDRIHASLYTDPRIFDDEMERIRGIPAVEDDLVARERPAAGNRQQPPHVLRRDVGKEPPFHRCVTSLTLLVSRM